MTATEFRALINSKPEQTLRAVIKSSLPNSYDNPIRTAAHMLIAWVTYGGHSKHPVDKARRRQHILTALWEQERKDGDTPR